MFGRLCWAALGAAAASAADWAGEDPSILQAVREAGLDGCFVARVDAAGLTPAQFREQVTDSPRPVLVTGLDTHGAEARAGWRREPFEAAFGGEVHRVRLLTGANQVGVLERLVNLSTFLAGMHHPDAGLLFDQAAGGSSASWTCPDGFRAAGLCEPVLSVGRAGAGLPLHNHNAAWESPVVGRKLVLLLEPASEGGWFEGPKEWRRAAPRRFLSSTEAVVRSGGWPQDWAPPGARSAHCLLGVGQVLWIPCNWYHATLNIGDCVAVGGQRPTAALGEEQCAEDVHTATRQVLYAARAGALPPDKELATLDDACRVAAANVHCAPLRAMVLARLGKKGAAVAAVTAAAGRYAEWWQRGWIGAAAASAVLAALAEALREPGPLGDYRPAEHAARALLWDACALDPARQNLRAHALRAALLITTPDGRGDDAPERALWEADRVLAELAAPAAAARRQFRLSPEFPVADEDAALAAQLGEMAAAARAAGLAPEAPPEQPRHPPQRPRLFLLSRRPTPKQPVRHQDEL
eukprot:TRINITY_DN8441_c0_g1_i3.p1 TRINITY_DN8441_c0_g1~~TRINITY_DN8441_c0_g1_i3.p1  ORF type:complete len:546 (+),score=184.17 TRINITY_DN8441_c0_g1_i3:67-1638(+)